MEITLTYQGSGAAFTATNADGHELVLDGSPQLGGEGLGPRPMEMVLFGLAGCAAMDVLHILRKSRSDLQRAKITATGKRADAVPAVFESVHLSFQIEGEGVTEKQAQRAIDLSLEKYCSVARMLSNSVDITAELSLLRSS